MTIHSPRRRRSCLPGGNAGLIGVGPRVEEPAVGLVAGYVFSAPYEDVKLKTR